MSAIPPPPLPVHQPRESPALNERIRKSVTPKIEECLWAESYPELQKACFLAKICAITPPTICEFYNINSILQVGPTCGLTALSMLLGGEPSPEHLLQDAQRKQYTNNGEMFSAHNLYQLICDYLAIDDNNNNNNNLPMDTKTQLNKTTFNGTDEVNERTNNTIDCHTYEGRLNCAKVRDELKEGACLFVPYDPDFNHSPCLKCGHKAHWALIVGYLITDNDEFYVLARHGKAKNLAAWSLQSLSDSNANLFEFAQPKGYPDCDFLLPVGGIAGDLGLRERAIIVKGLALPSIAIKS